MLKRFIFTKDYDGLFLSNGPGDPEKCEKSILNVRKWISSSTVKPVGSTKIFFQ